MSDMELISKSGQGRIGQLPEVCNQVVERWQMNWFGNAMLCTGNFSPALVERTFFKCGWIKKSSAQMLLSELVVTV